MPPLAAQPAAEELLAQLGPPRQRLFNEHEVRAFVDYCVAALQSCPEEARDLVTASWLRYRHVRGDGYNSIWAPQSLDLDFGKQVSATRGREAQVPVMREPEDSRPAHVDLANEREVEEQHVVDMWGPGVSDFYMLAYDIVQARDFKSASHTKPIYGRSNEKVRATLDRQLRGLTTGDDVIAWVNANKKFVKSQAVRVREFPDGSVISWSDGHGRRRWDTSGEGVAAMNIAMNRLTDIADELESAGWKRVDVLGVDSFVYADQKHPAQIEPEVNPRAQRRRRHR